MSNELFPRLGVAEQIKHKATKIYSERVGAVVLRGDAEIGFQQVSELLPIPGVDFVGVIPAPYQKVTIFSAGVAKGSKETEAGQQLIKFLTSKSVYPMIEKNGLEPAALAVAAGKK